ncbi:hypothetical protein J6590_075617 [Homalodisca vitripennis]|nr:hypothetical protein J6590_075617 [Homalodisca vitripennis]
MIVDTRQTSGPRDKRANVSIGKHYVHRDRQAAQGTSEPIFLLENTTYTEADKRPKGQASQCFYWKTLRTRRQTSGPRDKRANFSIGKRYVPMRRQNGSGGVVYANIHTKILKIHTARRTNLLQLKTIEIRNVMSEINLSAQCGSFKVPASIDYQCDGIGDR